MKAYVDTHQSEEYASGQRSPDRLRKVIEVSNPIAAVHLSRLIHSMPGGCQAVSDAN